MCDDVKDVAYIVWRHLMLLYDQGQPTTVFLKQYCTDLYLKVTPFFGLHIWQV